jgi:PAS domain S-box-containing protein
MGEQESYDRTSSIAEIQNRHKLSNKELATLLGVSRSTIQKWRSGDVSPPLASVNYLAILDLLDHKECKLLSQAVQKPGEVTSLILKNSQLPETQYNKIDAISLQRKVLEAERETRSLKQKFDTLVQNTKDYLLTLNPALEILTANPRFCEKIGYDQQHLVGKRFLDFIISPEERKRAAESVSEAENRLSKKEIKCNFHNSYGQDIIIKWQFVPLASTTGQIERYELVGKDISKIEKATENNVQLVETLRGLLNSAVTPRWIITENGQNIYVNNQGLALNESLGLTGVVNIFDVLNPESRERLKSIIQDLNYGDYSEFQGLTSSASGPAVHEMQAVIYPIPWKGAKAFCMSYSYGGVQWKNRDTVIERNNKLDDHKQEIISLMKFLLSELKINRVILCTGANKNSPMSVEVDLCNPDTYPYTAEPDTFELFKDDSHEKQLAASGYITVPAPKEFQADAYGDEDLLRRMKADTILAVPLMTSHSQLMGYLISLSSDQKNPWNTRNLEHVKMVAIGIRNILGNRIVHKEVYQINKELDSILQTAELCYFRWDMLIDRSYNSKSQENILGQIHSPDTWNERALESWLGRIHPNDRRQFIEIINEVKKGILPTFELTYRVQHADGHYVNLLNCGSVIEYDSKGKPAVLFGTLQDVSEAYENELNIRRNITREANAISKSITFISNVSHELRTPLNGLIGMVRIISNAMMTKQEKRAMGDLNLCIEDLRSKIEDLIRYAELQTGTVKIVKEEFCPMNFIQKCLDHNRPMAIEAGLSLSAKIGQNLPRKLKTDTLLLKDIVQRLLSNAIRFTNEGKVEFSMGGEFTEDGRFLLELMVKDTGVGINKDALESIFEPFEQGTNGITRKYEGFGLGLSATKYGVELLQGEICVDSTKGKGTTFTVKIPTDILDLNPVNEFAGTYNFLIVEDSKINQRVLSHMIEECVDMPYRLSYANNGEEALEILQQQKVDLVFLDLQMPVMDGATFLVELAEFRRSGELYDMPIIVISAMLDSLETSQFPGYPVIKALCKPYSVDELTEAIKEALLAQPSLV